MSAAVAAAVAAARDAQPAWEALGAAGRATALRRFAARLAAEADAVVATIVAETGKTHEDALLAEVAHTVRAARYWARTGPRELADAPVGRRRPGPRGRGRAHVRFRPAGVAAVIGPANFPLAVTVADALPALVAGNAVVLKPSPLTPRTAELAARLLHASGVPPAVAGVVHGGADAGGALVDAADVVAFTGSSATGRAVAARAAATLTPVSLELGGNDPMLVLRGADVARAADLAAHYGMLNAGQACTAVERVYVEDAVHDAFVAALAERVARLRLGWGGGPGTADVGALGSGERLALVEAHVADAVARGARVLVGGHALTLAGRPAYAPTVLVGADDTMRVVREETFGPVLPVVRVAGADEAVRRANDSPFGLQASVLAADARAADAVARRLECGVVCLNDAGRNYSATALPLQGWKASGPGVRHGAPGLHHFCRRQSVLPGRPHGREPHLTPNAAWRTRLLWRAVRLGA